jgi:hypothetical protein
MHSEGTSLSEGEGVFGATTPQAWEVIDGSNLSKTLHNVQANPVTLTSIMHICNYICTFGDATQMLGMTGCDRTQSKYWSE